ncbi:metal-transporting ATPase [Streptococcus intermedius]|uniref:heavy metal translocating P-type ATPase n=1 Tax=Streptococcus intermedius TaxID=1338 RepID=UPI0006CB1093|nr:heavy metal translocating P-type ATPase [Streptococcus intermedius]ALF28554.1 metal-transporting ATPase [Streptococcus intermedius]AVH83558.1 cadmium-translocating P-type ATPase [Streptococcus intermedius]
MKIKHSISLAMILYFIGILIYIINFVALIDTVTQELLSTLAMLVSGYHVLLEGVEETIQNTKKAGKFLPNTHILMALAALGTVLLENASEGALLIFIFAGAHFLEEYVENHSQNEITQLLQLNPTEARRINPDGSIAVVPVSELIVGDHVQVLNGGQVPTDGIILEGIANINEGTINGEAMPCEKTVGDQVFGATINGASTFIMQVTKDSSETVFAKILELVKNSQNNLSPTASRIRQFEPIYVNIVLFIFGILLLVESFLFHQPFFTTLEIGLIFMVSASPCAFAVSAIPATLASISQLARQGILFKGGAFLSNLSNGKVIAFDKTGTLTEGKPSVVSYKFEQSMLTDDKLKTIIVAMENQSNHPLATAIGTYFKTRQNNFPALTVENKVGEGLISHYQGQEFRIGKPSLFVNVAQRWISVKNEKEKQGCTVVFVSINEEVVGYIAFQDKPQHGAKAAIQYFKAAGIKTVMLTGDGLLAGQAIGQELGIDEVIANTLPEQKAAIIQKLKKENGITAMLGDGINDAPALVTSDIGIAMGEGTDIAIETADVILMKNDLKKLIIAYQMSKRLKRNIFQNIVFSMTVVVFLIIFTFSKNLSIIASISLHESSTLLVLLNSLRLLVSKKSAYVLPLKS